MTTDQIQTPKVFISYSWTSKEWVLAFASRLTGDGIHVSLDEWDVAGGQDLNVFMEKMVLDSTISKVLVICDRVYADKADNRKGGVGKESQIISQEVYERVDQTKFIPIVREKDDDGNAYRPVFMKSRLHYDFSSEERYHANYETLVRDIFGKPKHVRPALGKQPNFTLEDRQVTVSTKTSIDFHKIKNAIYEGKHNTRILLSEYLALFNESLLEFAMDNAAYQAEQPLEEMALERFKNMLPYRDEFVMLISHLCRCSQQPRVYIPEIIEFLQNSMSNQDYRPSDLRIRQDIGGDHYKLFTNELFIYLIASLIKYKQYQMVFDLTHDIYCIKRQDTDVTGEFPILRSYARSLEIQNSKLPQKFTNPTGVLFKNRATLADVPFHDLMQADYVLLLISILHCAQRFLWYPNTLIYAVHGSAFKLFRQAASKRYFDEVKTMLGVADKADLLAQYKAGCINNEIKNDYWRVSDWDGIQIPELGNFDGLAAK